MLLWSQLLILGLTFKANLPGCGCEKKIDASFQSNSIRTNVHKEKYAGCSCVFPMQSSDKQKQSLLFPFKKCEHSRDKLSEFHRKMCDLLPPKTLSHKET